MSTLRGFGIGFTFGRMVASFLLLVVARGRRVSCPSAGASFKIGKGRKGRYGRGHGCMRVESRIDRQVTASHSAAGLRHSFVPSLLLPSTSSAFTMGEDGTQRSEKGDEMNSQFNRSISLVREYSSRCVQCRLGLDLPVI